MEGTAVGLIGLCLFVVLLFLGMPIGFVMAIVGFLGFGLLRGFHAGLSLLATQAFRTSNDYILGVVPLFTAMGYLAMHMRLSGDLFHAAHRWFGHVRGGIAIATTIACTIFGAICGTSIGVAAAIGAIALPEMRKFKYKSELSTGLLSSAGNLGFLIPPSLVFVIYAIITEQSIGVLFIAGILPGVLLCLLFIATIYIWCRLDPSACTLSPPFPWVERLRAVRYVSGVLLVVGIVLAGIYAGLFTPTEAAAIGVFGVGLVGLLFRRFSREALTTALRETALLTGKIYLLIMGAMIFTRFVTVSEIPLKISLAVSELGLSPFSVLMSMLILYIVTGFFLDIIPIVLITAPVLHPLLVQMGYDPVWISVLVAMTILIGSVTPPFGMNVFALSAMVPDVPISSIFKGVMPFCVAMLVCLILILLFPQIALFLPSLMG